MSTRHIQPGELIALDHGPAWYAVTGPDGTERYVQAESDEDALRQEPEGGHTDRIPTVVQMPCSDTAPGHWFCAAHPDADTHNNFMMSSHVEGPGEHVEVWICHEHGPESAGVIVRP